MNNREVRKKIDEAFTKGYVLGVLALIVIMVIVWLTGWPQKLVCG